MKDLSLNLLDIAENSVKAGATLTQLLLTERDGVLTFQVADDGCGMTEEILKGVVDPFYTTRTTRKVGMGLPLLRMAAEQTGGKISISSVSEKDNKDNHGTVISGTFYKNHIDYTPLGDIVSTVTTLIQGHPDTDFLFIHNLNGKQVLLDTRQIREILEGVPLNSFEVIDWIEGYLKESYLET